MISVIIPHHQESEKEVSGLFSSINSQTGVDFNDFEIVVVNDDPKHILNFNKYVNIKDRVVQFTNPTAEYPGLSRQVGIDSCKGDYITFCDCDDELYSPLVFLDMIQRVKSNLDVYNYRFVQECMVNLPDGRTGFQYRTEDNVVTWVFAKLIKKQYLVDNSIRFSPETQWHEDTYFNLILFMRNPKTETIPIDAYLWKCNLKSVTRKNNFDYRYAKLPHLINAIDKSMDYAVEYDIQYSAGDLVSAITIQYMYCNSSEGIKPKYKKAVEKRLAQLINKWDLMELIFADDMKQFIEGTISGCNVMTWIPKEGFEHFIKRIVKKYPNE